MSFAELRKNGGTAPSRCSACGEAVEGRVTLAVKEGGGDKRSGKTVASVTLLLCEAHATQAYKEAAAVVQGIASGS